MIATFTLSPKLNSQKKNNSIEKKSVNSVANWWGIANIAIVFTITPINPNGFPPKVIEMTIPQNAR